MTEFFYEPMNFNGRSDSHPAQRVSFCVKWVHVESLPQGNKGHEEFCPAPSRILAHFSGVQFRGVMPNLERVSDVTRILERLQQGDPKAAEELLPLVYDELRKLAAVKMANEAPGQTLQPTALVHEVWLRLSQQSRCQWRNREQFYGIAAEVMRRILVDRARRRRKHGGDVERVDLDAVEPASAQDDDLGAPGSRGIGTAGGGGSRQGSGRQVATLRRTGERRGRRVARCV